MQLYNLNKISNLTNIVAFGIDNSTYNAFVVVKNSTVEEIDLEHGRFDSLKSTLCEMYNAHDEDVYKIDDETFRSALNFVAILEQHAISSPKVFSHGGDAVTFVWASDSVKRYVTIGDPRLSYFEILTEDGNKLENRNSFDFSEINEQRQLVAILGGRPWSPQTNVSLVPKDSPYVLCPQEYSEKASPWASFPQSPYSDSDRHLTQTRSSISLL